MNCKYIALYLGLKLSIKCHPYILYSTCYPVKHSAWLSAVRVITQLDAFDSTLYGTEQGQHSARISTFRNSAHLYSALFTGQHLASLSVVPDSVKLWLRAVTDSVHLWLSTVPDSAKSTNTTTIFCLQNRLAMFIRRPNLNDLNRLQYFMTLYWQIQ